MAYYLFNFSKKGASKGKTLREQASDLLQAGMWGIGAKTPNRLSLAPGDRVLIYVGAPEREFIGCAELASATHEWTSAEAAHYRGDWKGGVLLGQAEAWPHPVPIKSILPQLVLAEKNPDARFFAGVVNITKEDYETVVSASQGVVPLSKPSKVGASQVGVQDGGTGPIDLDLLFKTVEKLDEAAKLGGSLSEYDTRAEFIDKYLEALG